jgi:DNA polymerase-3 subunit delta'
VCAEAPGNGCGRCPECRLVAAGSHPDVFVEDLARAQLERPTATHLSIDQIRRVRSQLAMRPIRSKRKIGLIEPAERMTADGQNALLKTLEEPPGTTTLVLVTSNADALLPTIRSRCQRIRFTPLPAELVERLLIDEGVEANAARAASRLCDGSLDAARSFAEGDVAERCRELHAELARLERMTIPEVLDLAASLAPPRVPRDQQMLYATAVLDWCRMRLHDAARRQAEAANDPAPEREEDALDEVRRSLGRLARAYATNRDLERNANAHLAWDCLLLDLRTGGSARD